MAFVVWEVANLLFPALQFPAWTVDFVIVLTLLGFPIALVVAWAFELTPEGVQRTPPQGRSAGGGRRAVGALVGLGVVAAAVAGGWYLVGGGGGTSDLAGGATQSTRTGAGDADRSIAVLTFDNLSGTEDARPFVNGIHDDLLTRLSNISGLKVISRTSVLPYRDTELGVPAIADSLGVSWIVEGGVQQVGDRVQVNAQLIQAEEDAHRWAESYRRDLTAENLFDVQSELTKRIARSLEAELSPEETDRVERRPTEDLEAYRLYVRGRTRLDQRTETGMRQAAEDFHRAIERDSAYALAWSGLADARTLLVQYRYGPADTLHPRALEAARRAREIDPELAEAHASLGILYQELERDGPAGLRELHRAVELRPSYARAHHWLGYLLMTLGRLEEARRRLERAVELDPMSPPIHTNLAFAYRYAGRHQEALAQARRAEELEPGYSAAPLYAGITLRPWGASGRPWTLSGASIGSGA